MDDGIAASRRQQGAGSGARRLLWLGALTLLLGCSGPSTEAPPERIVLVVVDTLRRDHVSAYGGDVATPHIDALARNGQRIENAFGSFHQTTMSMGSLFSGHTPSLETGDPAAPLAWTGENWCGLRRFATRPEPACVPGAIETLAEALQAAGWETLGVTSNALLYRPAGFDQGFDTWVEADGGDGVRVTHGMTHRRADPVNWLVLRTLRNRRSDHFFLYVHYMDAHDFALFPFGRSYADGVRDADAGVGRLVAILEDEGLLANTLVVLTSDHGERLGERHWTEGTPSHGGNPSFEEVLAVPLILSRPHGGPIPELVRGDDIHRLILRSAGLHPRPGTAVDDGELLISERDYQTYRRGRFKIHRPRSDAQRVHLVDLERDPDETRDISARHPERVDELRQRLDAISARVVTRGAAPSTLTPEDEERLRALGYLE